MKRLTVALVVLTLVTACSIIKFNPDDPGTEILTKAVTAEVLRAHPDWAPRVANITTDMIALVDSEQIVSIDQLHTYVMSQVPKDLSPESKLAIDYLVGKIQAKLEQNLTTEKLPSDFKIQAKTMLTWVLTVADIYAQSLAVNRPNT